ncbi:MAG: hypothetical protein SNJ49_15475 [Chloracidobacterium sp.]
MSPDPRPTLSPQSAAGNRSLRVKNEAVEQIVASVGCREPGWYSFVTPPGGGRTTFIDAVCSRLLEKERELFARHGQTVHVTKEISLNEYPYLSNKGSAVGLTLRFMNEKARGVRLRRSTDNAKLLRTALTVPNTLVSTLTPVGCVAMGLLVDEFLAEALTADGGVDQHRIATYADRLGFGPLVEPIVTYCDGVHAQRKSLLDTTGLTDPVTFTARLLDRKKRWEPEFLPLVWLVDDYELLPHAERLLLHRLAEKTQLVVTADPNQSLAPWPLEEQVWFPSTARVWEIHGSYTLHAKTMTVLREQGYPTHEVLPCRYRELVPDHQGGLTAAPLSKLGEMFNPLSDLLICGRLLDVPLVIKHLEPNRKPTVLIAYGLYGRLDALVRYLAATYPNHLTKGAAALHDFLATRLNPGYGAWWVTELLDSLNLLAAVPGHPTPLALLQSLTTTLRLNVSLPGGSPRNRVALVYRSKGMRYDNVWYPSPQPGEHGTDPWREVCERVDYHALTRAQQWSIYISDWRKTT